MKRELIALIEYRLKEAEDSIEEAEVLLREGMSMRAVMNRLYYAMFYAVLALLQEKELAHQNTAVRSLCLTENLLRPEYSIKICQKHCIVLLNSGKKATIWNRPKSQRTMWTR
ncbi:MAG TPA: hypothetical protein DEP99_04110 [Nitrospiraceae bacterium]|nr:hypothetical protein [Nitrospiraceae bacterium]